MEIQDGTLVGKGCKVVRRFPRVLRQRLRPPGQRGSGKRAGGQSLKITMLLSVASLR